MAFRILLIRDRKPQQRKDNLNGIRNRFVHVEKLVRYLDSSFMFVMKPVFFLCIFHNEKGGEYLWKNE